MDRQLLNHQQYVVGSFQYQHLLDVVNLDVLQNLDELNPDVDLTCLVAVHLLHQLVEPVDVELHHQLRTDYFRDVVDVELLAMFHLQLKMDCYLGAV
jgi:hypothetical protein